MIKKILIGICCFVLTGISGSVVKADTRVYGLVPYTSLDSTRSSVQLVKTWTVGAGHTGNTNETSVYSWSMPGGTTVPGNVVRITSYLTFTNNGNDKTYRIKFGSKTYTNISYASNGAARYQTDIIVRETSSQLTVQSLSNSNGGWSTSASYNTSTENTANPILIDFTLQLTNGSDTATLEAVTIEVL